MFDKKSLFISHAEKDSDLVEKFVNLLYDIGISKESIFCSSISELGVPIKVDIYEYLRNLLDSEQVIPIFMLSACYYSSVACLNEMGAVWVKQKDYFTFLLPGFEFSKIKGAINAGKKGILLEYKSERELQNLKENLNQFKEEISHLFRIRKSILWERKRDEFITQIQKWKIDTESVDINLEECKGFCIGEYEHSGCIVTFDKIKNKIISQINFEETEAEICSIVIYTGDMDLCNQYMFEKKLVFDLKVSNTISIMELECRLKNRDVCREIVPSSDWEKYSIPLSMFGGAVSEWKTLKEIKFLLRRKNTSGGIVEIKNMMIK